MHATGELVQRDTHLYLPHVATLCVTTQGYAGLDFPLTVCGERQSVHQRPTRDRLPPTAIKGASADFARLCIVRIIPEVSLAGQAP
jgi:hypothetical protein